MLSTPFHLHLPSDANRALYPDNRAADYKVQLQHPISLSDKTPWEVGVTDIIIPADIQSTETEAWFQIQNVKGEVSKRYYVPGLHFYKSTRDFLSQFSTKLQAAETELQAAGFIDDQDAFTVTTNNPPSFTITTRLRQFSDNNAMYNAASFNSLILNQELANLFGLPSMIHLTSDNIYRKWREINMQYWYKDDKDLWISVSGFGQTDREEIKHYLPNPRSSTYRDMNHFLEEFISLVNHAVAQAKQSGKIWHRDEIVCEVNQRGKITFTFMTRLNSLPGRDITDTPHLNGISFSPALAYVFGLAKPWDKKVVRLIARNYYIDYQASSYMEDRFRGEEWQVDSLDYKKLGVQVFGKYSINLKTGAFSQNNPSDLNALSLNTSLFIFARTKPLLDMSTKTLKHYVEHYIAREPIPVGKFVTKKNDIVIHESGSSLHSVASSKFSLKSGVKVKSGHQQINIYSDNLVDTHCVGNEMKSLLRTVSHNRKKKAEASTSLKEINLSVPYYVPVKPGLRELRDIAIRIEDEHNHRMPFTPGKTSLDLHFRPAKRQKPSQFTVSAPCGEDVELQKGYEISQQWSVCLVDLHFPYRWLNVLSGEMTATLNVYNSSTEVTIPPGEYTTQSFLKAFDSLIGKVAGNNITLLKDSSNKFRNPVMFEVKSDPYNKDQENSIQLSSDLAQVLGLFEAATLTDRWAMGTGNQATENWIEILSAVEKTKHNITVEYTRRADNWSFEPIRPPSQPTVSGAYRKTRFTFPRKVDLNRGFKLFYVYAHGLIESVHIGHTKVPLLRQFIPQTSHKAVGEFVQQEFITPHYKQIKAGVNHVKKLNITITDELGRPIQFTGNVRPTATLHFQHM